MGLRASLAGDIVCLCIVLVTVRDFVLVCNRDTISRVEAVVVLLAVDAVEVGVVDLASVYGAGWDELADLVGVEEGAFFAELALGEAFELEAVFVVGFHAGL